MGTIREYSAGKDINTQTTKDLHKTTTLLYISTLKTPNNTYGNCKNVYYFRMTVQRNQLWICFCDMEQQSHTLSIVWEFDNQIWK